MKPNHRAKTGICRVFFITLNGKDKKKRGKMCVLLFTYVKCENEKGERRGERERKN